MNILVEYFRSAQGHTMGSYGDSKNWTPEQTAVYFLKEACASKQRPTAVRPDLWEHMGEFLGTRALVDSQRTDTPRRWTKLIREMTSGYEVDIKALFKTFDSVGYDEMIVVGPIKFYSLCEHHLMPFRGAAWVGYLPGKSGRIVGLSKLARLVSAHAKRFQVQERMTRDIGADIVKHLKPLGVGVRIESEHTCMAARGAEKEGTMRTQALLGKFRQAEVRAEFYNLTQEHGK